MCCSAPQAASTQTSKNIYKSKHQTKNKTSGCAHSLQAIVSNALRMQCTVSVGSTGVFRRAPQKNLRCLNAPNGVLITDYKAHYGVRKGALLQSKMPTRPLVTSAHNALGKT